MLWLKYYSETSGMYIQHAKNEGEYYCGNYSVDGINEKNKISNRFKKMFYRCVVNIAQNKTSDCSAEKEHRKYY